jgi:hypothetical protein
MNTIEHEMSHLCSKCLAAQDIAATAMILLLDCSRACCVTWSTVISATRDLEIYLNGLKHSGLDVHFVEGLDLSKIKAPCATCQPQPSTMQQNPSSLAGADWNVAQHHAGLIDELGM